MWWYDLWLSTLINFYDRFRVVHVETLTHHDAAAAYMYFEWSFKLRESRAAASLAWCDFPQWTNMSRVRSSQLWEMRSNKIKHKKSCGFHVKLSFLNDIYISPCSAQRIYLLMLDNNEFHLEARTNLPLPSASSRFSLKRCVLFAYILHDENYHRRPAAALTLMMSWLNFSLSHGGWDIANGISIIFHDKSFSFCSAKRLLLLFHVDWL